LNNISNIFIAFPLPHILILGSRFLVLGWCHFPLKQQQQNSLGDCDSILDLERDKIYQSVSQCGLMMDRESTSSPLTS